MNELEQLKNNRKGLIIHHWDTDGLCSAALLKRFFIALNSKIALDIMPPTINNYFLTAREFTEIKRAKYDFIITCDINFPPKVVLELEAIKPKKVFVFDHHKQDPIKEVHYYNRRYPSNTLVLAEYLELDMDLLISLGAIGDKEEKIKQDKQYWPLINKVLNNNNINFEQVLQIRDLVDASYVINDADLMRKVIDVLAINPLLITKNDELKNSLNLIHSEIQSKTERTPDEIINGDVLLFNIESNYNILSQATRVLARKYLNKIILTYSKKGEQTNIYIRRQDLDLNLSPLITWARSQKFNSGGKEEVVGIIINQDFSNIKSDLVNKIRELL
ncbi:MAG: DHH family phosphoesterase [Patescibacteria group bacterium]